MGRRILTIALNTYREAVRARLLLGMFALGLATCLYSVLVASLSLRDEERVIADLGAESLSFYAVAIAILVGSSSLYRELEHKTVFPILSRPIRRWEYLVGKYAGIVLTVAVFVAIEVAAVFVLLSLEAGQSALKVVGPLAVLALVLGVGLLRVRHGRVFLWIPWAFLLAVVAWTLASPSLDERQLVATRAVLAVCEVGIVAAIATLFASFSSPFLTAAFTSLVFVIGRSVDTMAHLPKRLFGNAMATGGRAVAHVVPNLHLYVPARPLLLGQVADARPWPYVGAAALYAVAYAAALLVLGCLAFRKRDFS
jgi:ABC-type transport system involved in multi-copper enzyme maturation permease subunit